jgi:hypothetical protein
MAGQVLVDRMPIEAEIQHALTEPPEDTRAWFRAHLLRRFGKYVTRMDWDEVTVLIPRSRSWSSVATIRMAEPWRFGRSVMEPLFQRCATLDELVEAVNSFSEETALTTYENRLQRAWGEGSPKQELDPPPHTFPNGQGIRRHPTNE